MKDFLTDKQETAVIIPAYRPDGRLPLYVRALTDAGVSEVVVVNDGSGEAYKDIFLSLTALPRVVLLHHSENRGKGEALKTAFRYALSRFSRHTAFVTADADGQHTVSDVLRILAAIEKDSALYLGVRSFSGKGIPWKSRVGNVTTRKLFLWTHGIRLTDTQTGLRGFLYPLLPLLISTEGSRFEYEMNMLIAAKGEEIAFIEIPIATVYSVKGERTTHFRPIRDSLAVTRAVVGRPLLFLLSAGIAAAIDLFLFLALREYLSVSSLFYLPVAYRTAVAKGVARVASSAVNLYFNFRHVFEGSDKGAILRYYLLWTVQLILSVTGTSLLFDTVGLPAFLAAAVTDLSLGIGSYFLQKLWVFRRRRPLCKKE